MPRKRRSRHFHGRSEVWERTAITKAIASAKVRLGARIRSARQARELSIEQAAERTGIHPNHLQRVETGRANVTVATLVAVSLALDVPLEQFFREKHS